MSSHENRPSLGSEYKDAKRNRRRDEILDAAATVFAQKGYFAATMQDIGEALGMRSASLYYYIESKEAALEEVCRRGGRAFVDQLREQLESDHPVPDIIERGIRTHLDSRWRDYVTSFAFNRQNLPGGALEEMNAIAREYVDLWASILDRGKKDGDLSPHLDSRFAANAVLAICNSAATSAPSRSAEAGATSKKVLALLLHGMRGDGAGEGGPGGVP